MNALFSGIKTQAMSMLPELIEKSKEPIKTALTDFIKENKVKNPNSVRVFSQNLNEINSVVQSAVTSPTTLPPATPAAVGGRNRKTRKHKKRTVKRQA